MDNGSDMLVFISAFIISILCVSLIFLLAYFFQRMTYKKYYRDNRTTKGDRK